ncbi:hypothetical protein M0R45_015985 [Rubus argutus]|uniref:Uncharacterized protein n=1 Tax=Rubus argutus TaxID=59490 RepID=A0AAW1XTQ9_RUBAR
MHGLVSANHHNSQTSNSNKSITVPPAVSHQFNFTDNNNHNQFSHPRSCCCPYSSHCAQPPPASSSTVAASSLLTASPSVLAKAIAAICLQPLPATASPALSSGASIQAGIDLPFITVLPSRRHSTPGQAQYCPVLCPSLFSAGDPSSYLGRVVVLCPQTQASLSAAVDKAQTSLRISHRHCNHHDAALCSAPASPSPPPILPYSDLSLYLLLIAAYPSSPSLTPSLISAGCSFSRRNHLTGATTASHQAGNSSRRDPFSLSPHDLSYGRIEE